MEIRKIPIKNIYYMLSYVWDKLDITETQNLGIDSGLEVYDLLADILSMNLLPIVKSGLMKQYIDVNESLSMIKGKIDFNSSIKTMSMVKSQMFCDFDEYNEDNIYNQVIKATIKKLLSFEIDSSIKEKLKKIYLSFSHVEFIELSNDKFSRISFNKNQEHYLFPIKVCHLIFNSILISEEEGNLDFNKYLEKNMYNIFELFIYKFYLREQKKFKVNHGTQMNWDFKLGDNNYIPIMKLDIELFNSDTKIIIDTKYYEEIYTKHYDRNKFRSEHLYQIFSYLSKSNFTGEISGVLLYPHNSEDAEIDEVYQTKIISNDSIKNSSVRFYSVNLNDDWKVIRKRLLELIE